MNRLYLHVGMMKTGTTYLQNALRANHAALAEQGVWFPTGPDAPPVRFATWDLVGRRPRGSADTRVAGQWAALTRHVAEHQEQTVILSEEYLAARPPRVARRAVAGFPHHEVHVVVTTRDWGRLLVSAWEETVKSGRTLTWPDFIACVRDRDASHRDPARWFWLNLDLPTVLETWAAAVGADRVHVVTVPPTGAPPGVLLGRLGQLTGFDAAMLTRPVQRTNESLGASSLEVVRRLNEMLGGRLNQRQYDFVVKRTIQSRLPRADSKARLLLPAEHVGWATEQAQRVVDHLRQGEFDVTGDVEDLLPASGQTGRSPTEVSDEELAESALQVLTVATESYAKLWWRKGRRDASQAATGTSLAARASSSLRGTGYRMRRTIAQLADRNRVVGAAMGIYLRVRRRTPPRAF